MGTIGRERIVKTFDGLFNMFFRNGYFCQPGIDVYKRQLKGTVTIRHRDSMKQERVAINDLLHWLIARVR